MSPTDSAVRAMTKDGAFRVITARTTQTVAGVIDAQRATGSIAKRLADLATGTILVRETMAPTLRVQGILQASANGGRIVADAFPGGGTRGLVQTRDLAGLEQRFAKASFLQVMRTMPNGRVQSGIVEVPTDGSIADGLMGYMQSSEQVMSMISVACVLEGDKVRAAGGYVVQLLPELSEEMLAIMTLRLQDFVTIDKFLLEADGSPDALLTELLYGMPYERLEESPLFYQCQCSAVRILAGLATLPADEIQGMIEAGQPLEIQCDYCGKEYSIQSEQLRGLIETS